MVKVGRIYKVKTRMLSKEYACKIRVLKLYKQRLGDMTIEDIYKEGYQSFSVFTKIWIDINHWWSANEIVDVVEFELFDNSELMLEKAVNDASK